MLWRYAHDSAKYLFGKTLGNPRAEKILAALKESPNGLTKWDIQKGVFKNNLKAALVDEALEILKGLNLITVELEKTGGREAERFRYADPTKLRLNDLAVVGNHTVTG